MKKRVTTVAAFAALFVGGFATTGNARVFLDLYDTVTDTTTTVDTTTDVTTTEDTTTVVTTLEDGSTVINQPAPAGCDPDTVTWEVVTDEDTIVEHGYYPDPNTTYVMCYNTDPPSMIALRKGYDPNCCI